VAPVGLRRRDWPDRGTRFLDLGPGHHETKIDKTRKARSYICQLEALGYTVTLTQAA
jgi:hypothetical protein